MINTINIPSETSPIPKGTMERGYMFSGGGAVVDTEKLVTITFTNTKPTGDYITWDVSIAQDGSVIAYYDKPNNTLTYCTEGTFYFPIDCSFLFYEFKVLNTINGLNLVDTSSVTDMSYMFYQCITLTSLDLSSFNTSSVTNMSSMFFYCRTLTSLDLSNFDTSNVTNMRYMFNTCDKLTSLDLSNFDTSNVTDMQGMLRYCRVLTSLNLSNFDTSNVTDMSYMLSTCDALTSFTVGNNFTMDNVTSYSMYLYYTGIDVPNYNTLYVYAEDGTSYPRSAKLPNGANTYYTYNPAA